MEKNKPLQIGALYIRVSTHMQEELSPDAQKRLLLDYAKANNIVVSEEFIFIENGVSGKKAERRPEFLRMISLAKQNPSPFNIILVWKFSRFARNQEESIVYKSLLKKQCCVDVISVSEPIIDGPFGSLIERIIEWMDEYYSIRLSGEVFRGMSEKAQRGGFQARPPLGYRIERKGDSPVIVEEEANIIRFIFSKYVHERMGVFEIARLLNSMGLKTSHGKIFERRSVEYILQNPMYCGNIRWNRTENETNRIKSREEWIIAKGKHEPIISEELFNQAQEIFSSKYKPKGQRPASASKHWLSGIVKCPECGRTMTSQNTTYKKNGKKYSYFSCYGYSKGKCVKGSFVSAKILEDVILENLEETLKTSNVVFEVKKNVAPENAFEKEAIMEALSKIPAKEARIKEAYRNGIDTLEEYKENKSIIDKEKNELEQKLRSLEVSTFDEQNVLNSKMMERIENVVEILKSDLYDTERKNEAIKSIISHIVFHKEEKLVDVFYYYS